MPIAAKNGRLQKFHYSKIQNAGDCAARTGVREIGFKFGSLPHDPGGITCMISTVQLHVTPRTQLFWVRGDTNLTVIFERGLRDQHDCADVQARQSINLLLAYGISTKIQSAGVNKCVCKSSIKDHL